MLRKLIDFILGSYEQQKQVDRYRELMRMEAKIGGEVFGPVGQNRTREFFCLDKNTWIWHEEWLDEKGSVQSKTTRYDVRPDAILKAQNNGTYHKVSDEEAQNLVQAAQIYGRRTLSELYGVSA